MTIGSGRLLATVVTALGLALFTAVPSAAAGQRPASSPRWDWGVDDPMMATTAVGQGFLACNYDTDGTLIWVRCDGDLYEIVISCYNLPDHRSGLYRGHLETVFRCSTGVENVTFVDHSGD